MHGRRHVTDLVEEDRAAVGPLEPAHLVPDGAGERTADVAEELTFQQTLGEGGAVDFDEILVAPAAGCVQGIGHEFLAGAALAGHENRGANVGEGFDHRKHFSDFLAGADDFSELFGLCDAPFQLHQPGLVADHHDAAGGGSVLSKKRGRGDADDLVGVVVSCALDAGDVDFLLADHGVMQGLQTGAGTPV